MCCGGCTGLLKREREGHRRRGKSTVHETQSRAIFHRRAQKRECARGFLHPRCVGRAREKGPFFHSVHHQSLPLGPPSLSDAPLVRQRSSAQEEFANPLLEENPLLFSFSPPLPQNQPANQPTNIYNVVPFARYRMRVWVSSWTFPTSFITQHPTVFLPPLKAFRLFFFL